jgi:hypothetical protein
MPPFVWKAKQPDLLEGQIGELIVQCQPLHGLLLQAPTINAGPLLGLEIVDAIDLGPQPLHTAGQVPDVVIRQDTLLVQYAPTTKRPVECTARWRVLPEGIIDLEVSTLTPGKWDDLAVQTRSTLGAGEIIVDDSVTPGILIYRPTGSQLSYAEFCHPHDGIALTTKTDAGITSARFRLFGHDLEKGVILRGRLRGILVPRAVDVAAARAAYSRFLTETPNLT